MPPRKILFITPHAGRTGSEMVLAYLLDHHDRQQFELSCCGLRGGELLRNLPKDVPGFEAPNQFSLLQKFQHKLGNNPVHQYLKLVQRQVEADIWYFNTLVPAFLLPLARQLGVRIVTHFHELPSEFQAISDDSMESVLTGSDLLIGCSEAVTTCLRQAGGRNVQLWHSPIDISLLQPDPQRAATLRARLRIEEDEFVWVMSGQSTYRKGFDLLPELAQYLAAAGRKVRLIWLGQLLDNGYVYYVRQRIEALKNTNVTLTGPQKEDYAAYLSLADGFVLLSREDPFPLVMLEAAGMGRPIVAFPSGGVQEFVQPGMGQVVDSWNLPDLAAAMQALMEGQLKTDPEISRARAAQFDIRRLLPEWEKLLRAV